MEKLLQEKCELHEVTTYLAEKVVGIRFINSSGTQIVSIEVGKGNYSLQNVNKSFIHLEKIQKTKHARLSQFFYQNFNFSGVFALRTKQEFVVKRHYLKVNKPKKRQHYILNYYFYKAIKMR